jgi:hypothetical protein
VCDDVWDTLRTDGRFSHLEKLVASFLRCDAVDGEATLNVVKKAEVFAGLFNGDDIWEIDTSISFLELVGWSIQRIIPMKPAG